MQDSMALARRFEGRSHAELKSAYGSLRMVRDLHARGFYQQSGLTDA